MPVINDSKKKKATSPIINREKESRSDINIANMDLGAWESTAPLVETTSVVDGLYPTPRPSLAPPSSSASRRSSTTSRESYATVTSMTALRKEKRVRESTFVTKKPEGAFRDELVVELQ